MHVEHNRACRRRRARLEIHVFQIGPVADARQAWANNETLIKRLARLESLTDADAAPKGAITLAVDGATFAIPLDGIIDIAEEKARLSKTMDKLAKEIGGLKGRLGNPAFVASAPEEVVDEARGNLEAREDEAAKLQAALARLADVVVSPPRTAFLRAAEERGEQRVGAEEHRPLGGRLPRRRQRGGH